MPATDAVLRSHLQSVTPPKVASRFGWPAALVALMAATLLLYGIDIVFRPASPAVSELFQKFAGTWLFFGAAVLCVAKAQVSRQERLAWWLFALAMGLWGTASLYYALFLWTGAVVAIPSVADVLWIAFYVPASAALLLLLRQRVSAFSARIWLDALVTALGVGGASAALVFGVVLDHTSGTAAATATNLAYPIGDLGLLALVLGAITVTGWRGSGVWRWIAPAFLIFWVTDSVFLVQVAQGHYAVGGIGDLGWPAAALLVGMAAWRAEPAAEARTAPSIMLPAAAGLGALALFLGDHFVRTNPLALGLATATLLVILIRLYMTVRDNRRMLARSHREAMTDVLTGLGNRRKLFTDMEGRLARLSGAQTVAIGIFDLDAFKAYNDTFGHPAGDALLARLGNRLAATVGVRGDAYRIGGDEFVVVTELRDPHELMEDAQSALREHGEAFAIGCSLGSARIDTGVTLEQALHIADQRLYANKRSASCPVYQPPDANLESAPRLARFEVKDVLLQVLAERNTSLVDHLGHVAQLAASTATAYGLPDEDVQLTRLAAELHDIGKLAIPDSILDKPGLLTSDEWAFLQRHSAIGERIVGSAPTLKAIAPLVRASHERVDGTGYPDGLHLDAIPIASRIIAVADAFEAMTTGRPYRTKISRLDALAELHRHAGTQFDPSVVTALVTALAARPDPLDPTHRQSEIPTTNGSPAPRRPSSSEVHHRLATNESRAGEFVCSEP